MTRAAWSGLLAPVVAFVVALIAIAQPANAAIRAPKTAGVGVARGVSYTLWTVNGTTVHMRFVLPEAEAAKLDRSAKGRPDAASAASAVSNGTSVRSAGGVCPAIVQSEWVGKIYTLALTPGVFRYEVTFECPSADGLVLHDGVLFKNDPRHVNYARIQVGAQKPALQVFSSGRQDIALGRAGAAPKGAGLIAFAKEGALRLFGQLDRLLVLAALLLVCRRWKDIGAIAGAMAVGYVAAFAVAMQGVLTVDPVLTGAVVGLIAALVGLAALRMEALEPAPKARRVAVGAVGALLLGGLLAMAALRGLPAGLAAGGLLLFGFAQLWLMGVEPSLRWVAFAPAALLGLLDGMGLSRDLQQLELPRLTTLPAFVGYDLGAVASAAALAAVGMTVLWLAGRRLRFAREFAVDLAAASLVGVGLFLFVSRLYS
jgi:hypothetical protein